MKHICTSVQKGDLIIYTCNLCPKYKRSFNVKTKKMTTVGATDGILHSGSHVDLNTLFNPN